MNWKAIYKDGSSLKQNGCKYTDIDRPNLDSFEMWEGEKLILSFKLGDGKRLICRRRPHIDSSSKQIDLVWLVGWQKTVNGKNIQKINIIHEDGRIEVIDKWRNEDYYYSPKLMKQEKEV